MREDDSNWFSKWEDDLPAPEDLMPLSQTLITPDLALAFNIPNRPAEFDSQELGGAEEPARTLKRPRLVWTPQLHKRFVDAVAHLGIKNAVPKTIMRLMSVDGLTRENVASHLQKYRLYLKRIQGMSTGGVDAATDRLFASSPVPSHFLHASASAEHLLPFVPMQQQHMPGPHQHQFRHFGSSPPNGQFDQHHPFMRQLTQAQRIGTGVAVPTYADDLERANGRRMLTLFPTGDD